MVDAGKLKERVLPLPDVDQGEQWRCREYVFVLRFVKRCVCIYIIRMYVLDGWMDGWMHGCMDAWIDWLVRTHT